MSRVRLDNEPSKPSLSPQQEQNKSPPLSPHSGSHYCVIDSTARSLSRWPGKRKIQLDCDTGPGLLVTTAQPPRPRPARTARRPSSARAELLQNSSSVADWIPSSADVCRDLSLKRQYQPTVVTQHSAHYTQVSQHQHSYFITTNLLLTNK